MTRRVYRFFDDGYVAHEQLPRLFIAQFDTVELSGRLFARVYVNGQKLGDDLTDNAHVSDDYRLHDIVHLSLAAVLAWSPICRRNLKAKRRSSPAIDEVEDGGRAGVTEEGISQLIFEHARHNRMFAHSTTVSRQLIREIRQMASPFEVRCRKPAEWERAILMAYSCWRWLSRRQVGVVVGNMFARSVVPSDDN